MNNTNKKCKKCLIDLPLSEFKPHPETKDKLQVWCNQCRREYALAYYNKNKKEQNERRRASWKDKKI